MITCLSGIEPKVSSSTFIQIAHFILYTIFDWKSDKDLLAVDSIQWADGFLLVYSILDKASFDYIQRFRRHVLEIRNIGSSSVSKADQQTGASSSTIPCVLVANKADMVHLRQVPTHEGNLNNQIKLIPRWKNCALVPTHATPIIIRPEHKLTLPRKLISGLFCHLFRVLSLNGSLGQWLNIR